MIHLRPADYIQQPWKNGRGVTTELWRLDHEDDLLVRLSCATVAEDGPFSVFSGIARNLTVTSGKGFRLVGKGIDLRCDPLVPVAFPGDVAVEAVETGGAASDDFNVLTALHLPRPEVRVVQTASLSAGGLRAFYALGPCRVNGNEIGLNDLILTREAVTLSGSSPVVAVRFSGLPVTGRI